MCLCNELNVWTNLSLLFSPALTYACIVCIYSIHAHARTHARWRFRHSHIPFHVPYQYEEEWREFFRKTTLGLNRMKILEGQGAKPQCYFKQKDLCELPSGATLGAISFLSFFVVCPFLFCLEDLSEGQRLSEWGTELEYTFRMDSSSWREATRWSIGVHSYTHPVTAVPVKWGSEWSNCPKMDCHWDFAFDKGTVLLNECDMKYGHP
jgi:hypothetical protein